MFSFASDGSSAKSPKPETYPPENFIEASGFGYLWIRSFHSFQFYTIWASHQLSKTLVIAVHHLSG